MAHQSKAAPAAAVPRPATYLDTSVYNALLDDSEGERLRQIIPACFDVWASFHTLSELLDTSRSSGRPPERASRLVELLKSLMQHTELLAHPRDVLIRALASERDRAPALRFGFDPAVFAETISWSWLRHLPMAELEATKAWKAALRKGEQEWRRMGRLALGQDTKPPAAIPPLEEALHDIFRDPDRMNFLFRDEFAAAGASPDQLGDLEATARKSLVWYPFLVAELIRRHLTLAGQPSADLTDTMHAVYLPCVTWFITNDHGQKRVFEETVRWCYPLDPKRVVDYDEFRATLLADATPMRRAERRAAG